MTTTYYSSTRILLSFLVLCLAIPLGQAAAVPAEFEDFRQTMEAYSLNEQSFGEHSELYNSFSERFQEGEEGSSRTRCERSETEQDREHEEALNQERHEQELAERERRENEEVINQERHEQELAEVERRENEEIINQERHEQELAEVERRENSGDLIEFDGRLVPREDYIEVNGELVERESHEREMQTAANEEQREHSGDLIEVDGRLVPREDYIEVNGELVERESHEREMQTAANEEQREHSGDLIEVDGRLVPREDYIEVNGELVERESHEREMQTAANEEQREHSGDLIEVDGRLVPREDYIEVNGELVRREEEAINEDDLEIVLDSNLNSNQQLEMLEEALLSEDVELAASREEVGDAMNAVRDALGEETTMLDREQIELALQNMESLGSEDRMMHIWAESLGRSGAEFGSGSESGGTEVPEPTSALLLGLGLLGAGMRQTHRLNSRN